MRNAVIPGVGQDRLDTVRRNLKLFYDFGDAHAVVEVIDNRVDRGSAAIFVFFASLLRHEVRAVRVMEHQRAHARLRLHHHPFRQLHADVLRTQ